MLVDEWNHHKDFLAQQEKRIVDTKDQFRAREQILMEREKADVTRTQNVAEVNGPSKSPAPREGQISNTNHMQGLRKGELRRLVEEGALLPIHRLRCLARPETLLFIGPKVGDLGHSNLAKILSGMNELTCHGRSHWNL